MLEVICVIIAVLIFGACLAVFFFITGVIAAILERTNIGDPIDWIASLELLADKTGNKIVDLFTKGRGDRY